MPDFSLSEFDNSGINIIVPESGVGTGTQLINDNFKAIASGLASPTWQGHILPSVSGNDGKVLKLVDGVPTWHAQ